MWREIPEITVINQDQEIDITLDVEYLRGAIQGSDSETIVLAYKGMLNPIKITNDIDYVSLVAPIKL